jgi:hypothetical protein
MRPLLGWGGWNRSRVVDKSGQDKTIADSAWIIAFGQNGAAGLLSMMACIVVPVLILPWRIPPPLWTHPITGSAAGAAVVLAVWMIDNTVNAMINPLFLAVCGGVAGMKPIAALQPDPAAARVRKAPQPNAALTHRERVLRRRAAVKRGSSRS